MPTLRFNPDGSPHIHQYVRAVKLDGTKDRSRYRCNHPDCTTHDFKNNLIGKRSLCGVCGVQEIILDTKLLRTSRPACFRCAKNQKAESIKMKVAAFEDLFGEGSEGAPQI